MGYSRSRDEGWITVHCDFSSKGRYEVTLFGNTEQYGSYQQFGQLAVNNGS